MRACVLFYRAPAINAPQEIRSPARFIRADHRLRNLGGNDLEPIHPEDLIAWTEPLHEESGRAFDHPGHSVSIEL
eukprot:2694016-Rhodomonas_salina.1